MPAIEYPVGIPICRIDCLGSVYTHAVRSGRYFAVGRPIELTYVLPALRGIIMDAYCGQDCMCCYCTRVSIASVIGWRNSAGQDCMCCYCIHCVRYCWRNSAGRIVCVVIVSIVVAVIARHRYRLTGVQPIPEIGVGLSNRILGCSASRCD